MNYLVTGATGHIGNVLVRQLLDRGHTIRGLVRKNCDLTPLKGLPLELFYGNICNYESMVPAFNGMDAVFHLAGVIGIGSGEQRLMRQVNVEGTKNVVRACEAAHVPRLIYTSSVHALPEAEPSRTMCEIDTFSEDRVRSGYAKTKAAATGYCSANAPNAGSKRWS